MDFDCISRLVEIDAILEEDRDESMDVNYRIASKTSEEVDLDLLVTLKNPTISKQKQIQIGLETLTGMASELWFDPLKWPLAKLINFWPELRNNSVILIGQNKRKFRFVTRDFTQTCPKFHQNRVLTKIKNFFNESLKT